MAFQLKGDIRNNLAFNGAMIAWRSGQGLLLWIVLSNVEIAVEAGQSRFAVVMGVALLVPLIIRVILPTRATTLLAALDAWLEKHDRVLTAAMLALMGVIFIALGFERLDLI